MRVESNNIRTDDTRSTRFGVTRVGAVRRALLSLLHRLVIVACARHTVHNLASAVLPARMQGLAKQRAVALDELILIGRGVGLKLLRRQERRLEDILATPSASFTTRIATHQHLVHRVLALALTRLLLFLHHGPELADAAADPLAHSRVPALAHHHPVETTRSTPARAQTSVLAAKSTQQRLGDARLERRVRPRVALDDEVQQRRGRGPDLDRREVRGRRRERRGEQTGENRRRELVELRALVPRPEHARTHIGLDVERRVLEHRVEEVETALQQIQVVEMIRDLYGQSMLAAIHPRTCSPPQLTRYGTSWCSPGSLRRLPSAASRISSPPPVWFVAELVPPSASVSRVK